MGELLRIGIEIADALEKAHRRGILHRDLKPANIMLAKNGAKLMDFGLAKAASSDSALALESLTQSLKPTAGVAPVTAQGTIVGTFQYMSPEQGRKRGGCSLRHLFTRRRPVRNGDRQACVRRKDDSKCDSGNSGARATAHLEHSAPVASGARPTVKTCLAKDPDERLQSVHDVKLQLEWIRKAGSHAGMAVPVAAHRKNRERLVWAGATMLLIIAAIFAARYFARRPHQVIMAQIESPEKHRLCGSDRRVRLAGALSRRATARICGVGRRRQATALGADAQFDNSRTSRRHRGGEHAVLVP